MGTASGDLLLAERDALERHSWSRAYEILASAEALEDVGATFPTSEPGEVIAKGIPEPVRVVSVGWRPTGSSGAET